MQDRRTFLATTLGAMATTSPIGNLTFAAPQISAGPLKPPVEGKIKVAFALNEMATIIDFGGPWEVFQDVMLPDRGMPFELYTVAPTTGTIVATGGMRIVPDYAVADAPRPHVVVVPAQRSHPDMLAWLAEVAPRTDLTMSVCTGAFQLGKAGLLDGMTATTHHDFYDLLAEQFPKIVVLRGLRFVEHERIATAGGLTSGIDLALRVVTRYFDEATAERTARYMEYASDGWRV